MLVRKWACEARGAGGPVGGDTWRITIRGIYVLAPNSAAYVCGTSASLLRDDAPAAYRSSLILDGAALFLKSVLQAS